jgi:hypothetical protein
MRLIHIVNVATFPVFKNELFKFNSIYTLFFFCTHNVLPTLLNKKELVTSNFKQCKKIDVKTQGSQAQVHSLHTYMAT